MELLSWLIVCSELFFSTNAQVTSSYFMGNSSGPSDGYQLLNQADKSPNASSTVTFPFPQARDWTWTLQISDVDKRNASDNLLVDTHVAYTTWRFSASSTGDTSGEQSSASASPTCIYLIDVPFPANVSASWSNSSASCTSAIGTECEAAVLNHLRPTDDCFSGNFNSLGSDFTDACGGAFGGQGFSTQGYREFKPLSPA